MSYHRPTQIADVFEVLKLPGIQIVAGATDVFPANSKPALTGPVLDLTGIPGLCGISETTDGWRIGATTKWAELARAKLPPAFAALQTAALQIGSPQIQNSATVAGNLCNASPAADGVPPLLVLDAMIELTSQTGARRCSLETFILGVRKTALRPGEIVTAIHIPARSVQGASAFEKLGARKYLVISICMVAVRINISGGKIDSAAISVGACSPVATRLSALEQQLVGAASNDPESWESHLPEAVKSMLSPIADIRSDASYRLDAAVELTTKTIRGAIAAQFGGTAH